MVEITLALRTAVKSELNKETFVSIYRTIISVAAKVTNKQLKDLRAALRPVKYQYDIILMYHKTDDPTDIGGLLNWVRA